MPNGHNQTAAGSSDPYSSDSDPDDPAYIDLLKREDVYPERARFDQLSREEANRLGVRVTKGSLMFNLFTITTI